MRSSCQPLRACLRRCSTRRQTNRFLGPATELYDRPRDVHSAASLTVLQSGSLVIAYKSALLSSLASTQHRQPSVFSYKRHFSLSCLLFLHCVLWIRAIYLSFPYFTFDPFSSVTRLFTHTHTHTHDFQGAVIS